MKIVANLEIDKFFCIQITFNNPIRTCFSNNILFHSIQTRTTQIENYISIKKRFYRL